MKLWKWFFIQITFIISPTFIDLVLYTIRRIKSFLFCLWGRILAGNPSGSQSFMNNFFVYVLRGAWFSVAWNHTTGYLIEVAVFKLFLGDFFNKEIIQILFSLILFLSICMVITLHFIQFLQLFLGLLIKLLFDLELRSFFWCSWRGIRLFFFDSLALATVSPWAIKLF